MGHDSLFASIPTKSLGLFAAILVVAINAHSQDCSSSASNKAGDTITVTVLLQTDDANENGEGEPVLIASSGGEFTAVVDSYFSFQPFSYVATQANETVSGTLSDSDGDEMCSITLAWDQPQFISTTTKTTLTKIGDDLFIASGGAWTVSALCAASLIGGPICGIESGVVAAVTATAGAIANRVAADPPDANFTEIATPVFPSIPTIRPGQGAPQALADAANSLLANEGQIIGIETALVTTLNRASGASVAQNDLWVQRQLSQANLLEAQLAVVFTKEAPLLVSFQSAITAVAGNTVITASQVQDFENGVASDGLPADDIAALQQLGVDETLLSLITNQTFVQDVDAVAQFPGSFADPTLLGALQAGSRELNPNLRRRAVKH